jgi:malate dehydrogenase
MATLHRKKKIAVIGAGFVGSTCAHWAAAKQLGDVVLLDVNEGAAKGKALDLYQSAPVEQFASTIQGTSKYEDIAGSDIVIITAGIPRKPGMSRDDLLKTNAGIMKVVCQGVKKHAPESIVIVVSNPLDAMAYVAKDVLGFPRNRVLGMAGVLDGARMRTFIAEELKVCVKDVNAFVLGGHGDTMVPMPRHCSVGGIPLLEILTKEKVDAIVQRTREGGAEIVKLLQTGSAYYAPAASAVQMAEAILFDQKRILPCAALLEGEYGVNGLFVGVLCKLGGNGLEKVMEIKLNDTEKADLDKSVAAVKGLVEALKTLEF